MKIAQVTSVFKSCDTSLRTNYPPISVLPCFSKMLEKIMYNRLYKHLTKNNLFNRDMRLFKNARFHHQDHLDFAKHLVNV